MDATSQIAERVRVFLARERAVPIEKISFDSMLSWDFDAFAKEFDIDPESFSSLSFERHFGSEGVPLWGGGLLMLILLPAFLLGFYMRLANWGVLGLALLYVVLFVLPISYVSGKAYVRRHRGDPDPIRVWDLVVAAEAKRWLKRDKESS